jgi:type IV secretion system protein VirB6
MQAGLLFLALCLLAAIFFLQTPAIAAGIAGGASVGLADFGAAAAKGAKGLTAGRSSSGGPQGGGVQVPKTGGSLRPLSSKI